MIIQVTHSIDCFNAHEIGSNFQSNISEVKRLSQYRYYIPKENAGVVRRRMKNPCKNGFTSICYHLMYFFLKYISQTTEFVKQWWLACFLNSFKIKASFKVYIFWEGHKILRNLHQLFDWAFVHRTNNWWRFRKILWPSQNIWTLRDHPFLHVLGGEESKICQICRQMVLKSCRR